MPEFAAKGGAPTPFVNAFDQVAVGSLRYNTSQMGSPLPICYGTQRISINLLEFWGYTGGPQKFGGKGGGGGKNSKKQANYSVYVAMAICQGPISLSGSQYGSGDNNRIWANAGIAYGAGSVGLNAYGGADGQAGDSVFEAQDPNTPVLNYSGTAYATGDPMQLGQSPSLPNLSFEVTGFEAGTSNTNFPDDAAPGNIVIDLLTNPRYGAEFPAANLDSAGSIADFNNYCSAASLAMSLLLDRCQPAARWVEEICQLCVAAPFWSGALFKIVPYWVASITGNGVTWNPNLTPIYSVDDGDYVEYGGETDPVTVTRSDPTQATNWFGVEYYDASNAYNPNIAYSFDQGAIDEFGLRNEPVAEAHSMTNITTATVSAQYQLQRKQSVRNTFKFQLNWTFALLDPMDTIEITDSILGLVATPVRITSITENENGELEFECEELPAIQSSPPLYNRNAPASSVPNVNAMPPNVNAPVIFEPSGLLTGGDTELWILVTGMPPNWGGANVYASTDGTTYQFIGSLYKGATQGTLTAGLAAFSGTNPDTTNTLSVSTTESEGTLMTVASSDAADGISLCYVDGELLAYETATLTGPNQYNLTTLYRGLYGTGSGTHPSGSMFAYVGLVENIGTLRYEYPTTLVGNTIYFKFQSFNDYLGESQDISTLTPVTYTLNGAGEVVATSIPFSFPSALGTGSVVLNNVFTSSFELPANFAGSVIAAYSNTSSSSQTLNVAKNGGSPFGTITFAAGATLGTFAGTGETFGPGDSLSIVNPVSNPFISDISGTIAGFS
jgi:Putative phage tail protein